MEKQIEEMAKIINKICFGGECAECEYYDLKHPDYACRDIKIAKILVELNYRKASEVEKETFDRLSNNMEEEVEGWKKYFESLYKTAKTTIRADVAREIFEEIEERLRRLADESKILRDKEINLGEKTQLNGEWIGVRLALRDIAELKKKYTEISKEITEEEK